MVDSISKKLEKVFAVLSESSPVLVAFSGGVDSTLVLKLSLDHLGEKAVLAATGISPSISEREQLEAKKIAKQLGGRFLALKTDEMENENYRSNPTNRCFFCKEELFKKLDAVAKTKKYKTILDGTNADDVHDWRPGLAAAKQYNVRSPLAEAHLTKDEIRQISRSLNLPNWDKPAMPCLSSRVPYGEPITMERIKRIHEAEEILRDFGFREVRVRDHFPIARIEVEVEELPRLVNEPLRTLLLNKIKSTGYQFVTVDLRGFKSGSLNHAN